ncbi:MAG: hypothetical protein B7Y15_11850 [Bacteroidetes bacterium 24-39-8]|nr:MAG: hypothetical protein B7Y69_06370 [Sphingobacteriia bacterium 35-40-8]OYZ48572.1 MAG: hypothetical protein B7Y15_11850 [Bacteroidetes bacterium 24-39-8]OZA69637.1 MAG: hypothetical protein B7X72_00065 [Sphingobacteriia bacterium 39-39-8]HQR93174.1 DUF1573 domain-containing protein [Sediminibacterium sp.]HQS55058.1 DUF1573 domain-containing protein [Sediminibacterium sp.]
MKSILLCLALFATSLSFAQTDIKFKEQTHKFGKIKKGVPASYTFSYTNTSAKPVVIEFAQADCGCTDPVYSKAPLPKGQTATIKVTYNAAMSGIFKKTVNIKFAHSNQPYILTVEGEVLMDKETQAKLDAANKKTKPKS